MPYPEATTPRVLSFTVSEATYATVKRLAAHRGQTSSAFLRELLEATMPTSEEPQPAAQVAAPC